LISVLQRDVYDDLIHVFLKIIREEGPAKLYNMLASGLIGVVPFIYITEVSP